MIVSFWGDSLTTGLPGISFLHDFRKEMKDSRIINQGKTGDTAVSLLQRIRKSKPLAHSDVIILWIGLNEILVKVNPAFGVVKKLSGRSWSISPREYREVMETILAELISETKKLIVVPPLWIGETDNQWNEKIREWNAFLPEAVDEIDNAAMLDLLPVLKGYTENSSGYFLHNPMRIFLDGAFYKTKKSVDRLSRKRGLSLTVDGVHLNSLGSRLVAQEFRKKVLEVTDPS